MILLFLNFLTLLTKFNFFKANKNKKYIHFLKIKNVVKESKIVSCVDTWGISINH